MVLPGRDGGPRFATIHGGSGQRSAPGPNGQNVPAGSRFAVPQGDQYAEPSIGNRCAGCLRAIPLVTALSTIIMIGLFIWTAIKNSSQKNFAVLHFGNIPFNIVELHEYWRLFTPGFFHLNVLHVLLNMLMALFISTPIERAIGSMCMAGLIFVFAFVPQVIYLACFYLAYAVTGDASWLLRAAAGYSAHLFGYIVILIVLFDLQSINFCGCFNIPAAIYPWFLLLITSLMNSSASFVGHLSGLLCAYLYVYGLLNWMSLPRSWLLKMESYVPRFISSFSMYVPTPELQNALLYQKQLPFTRKCAWNRGGARDTSNPSTQYRSASSFSRGAAPTPSSASQGSRAGFSGPGHVLGSAGSAAPIGRASASGPGRALGGTGHVLGGAGPNASQHQVRDIRVLPIASAPPLSSLNIEPNASVNAAINAPAPGVQTENQNGTGYSVRSPNRRRGQYSELIDEEEGSGRV